MIRFIWRNWRRKEERFILLIFGVLVISVGLSLLVGLSDTNKGTVVDELQQRWSASYHIIVRPEGTDSVTEKENLLDPNFLSGIDGGIRIEQYEKIKEMTDIDVAAPIAMIGLADFSLNLVPLELEEESIYRLTEEKMKSDGIRDETDSHTSYFSSGNRQIVDEKLREHGGEYFLGYPAEHLMAIRSLLLAGIDPEQEAKLIGLDQAILDQGNSRYFQSEDRSERVPLGEEIDEVVTTFPVIVNTQSFTDIQMNYMVERLDIPFKNEETLKTLEKIEEEGGEAYLDTIEATDSQTYSFTDKEIFTLMLNSLSAVDIETGEPFLDDYLRERIRPIVYRPSPLRYKTIQSPFPEKWPYAYELETFIHEGPERDVEDYRELNMFTSNSDFGYPNIEPNWIGFYDSKKLNISQDPTNELPMETYRPAFAELVVDENDKPMNPPQTLQPMNYLHNFLAPPPNMLTTIEAAEMISGEAPISAIRIKVAGVENMSDESQKLLERIARDIEEETGLMTDITLGSSPQPTLTHVPALNDEGDLGWFQQPWVKLGSSITLFREAKIGYSGIIMSVLAVAVLYVWASGLVSLLSRRKEFAILLAVGWRPTQLSKLLLLESTLLGIFAATVSWIILGLVYVTEEATISPMRFLLTGLTGFVVYVLGAMIPAILAKNIRPYSTMRTGEISSVSKRFIRTKGAFSHVFNHFIGKWKRSILSIISIAIPTSLLALFIYVTLRLKGVMYTTWLGQYVALEVGPVHYTAMIVALIIAILTTAEIMWQNITERSEEMALLKAIGWKNRNIRVLVWLEGFLTGIFAAILSLLATFVMLWGMYGKGLSEELYYILYTGFIPIIVGVLGTIIPAEKAVKTAPVEGMKGSYSNQKVTENRLKWLMISLFLVLVGVFIFTIVKFFL